MFISFTIDNLINGLGVLIIAQIRELAYQTFEIFKKFVSIMIFQPDALSMERSGLIYAEVYYCFEANLPSRPTPLASYSKNYS
ncbi:unnamed protein product [Didymodactylos carnosus]|uniref:Uncharacterized protein n=1 Tax=Didymodactylos carnosus TaxID=1234261 RepID=A0A813Y138_9BILA|nr:unnamed protein product [Didymodactylos carnosus]CAF3665552.1 unnamed protein product [Didymodactylos carnosus]